MPTSTSTPNVIEVAFRSLRKTFEFGFFEDDLQVEPIIPFDTNQYPRVQIKQPDGQVYLTRTPPSVRPSSGVGFWAFDFDVPPDAAITGINESWEFSAEVVNAAGRHETYRTTFTVKDPAVVKSGKQSRFYPSILGRELQLILRSPVPFDTITLDIVRSGSDTNLLVENAVVGNDTNNIKHLIAEGVHVYTYLIRTQLTANHTLQNFTVGQWQAHWSVRETAANASELVYQIIEVYSNTILGYVPRVRFIVDKLEKRHTTRQAYDEADILGGLQMGVQFVNTVFPTTSWTLSGTAPDPNALDFQSRNPFQVSESTIIPPQIAPYVVLGAAYWVYLGQLGLAVDLSFNFSGSRVTLDQDQTGGIEGLLDKYRAALWEQLKEVKLDLLRQQRRVGVVATRPARARYIYNTVFRVDALVSSNVVGFLNSIGLIIVLFCFRFW